MKVRVIEADGETTTEDLKDHLENWHSWMYEDMHESMAPTVKELARAPAFSRFVMIHPIKPRSCAGVNTASAPVRGRRVVNNDPDIGLITRERRGPEELAEEHEDEHDPDMPDAPEDHRH
jgi:hypothetical protein